MNLSDVTGVTRSAEDLIDNSKLDFVFLQKRVSTAEERPANSESPRKALRGLECIQNVPFENVNRIENRYCGFRKER